MCTEADMWWRKVWKEHYHEQYELCYKLFGEYFDRDDADNELKEAKQTLLEKIDQLVEAEPTEKSAGQDPRQYMNSVGYILQILNATSLSNEPRFVFINIVESCE